MSQHVGKMFLLLFLLPAFASAADDDAQKAIADSLQKYVAAYDAGDLATVMGYWAEDADFVDIRGNFHQGRDLISALFRRGLADHPGRKIKFTSDSRKMLAPGVLIDDGIIELTSPDGESARGRYSVVWTKTGDKWLIRSARDIPLDAAPPAADAPPPLEELAWLVGKWEAKSEKFTIALDCNWQLNKSFLAQKFQIKSSEEEFTVITFIAYDPSEECFQSWYFDSRGGFGSGPWSKRGDAWRTAIYAVLPDGSVGSSTMIWQKVDDNTAQWKAVDREVEGEPLPDAEQTYVRVKE